jgi:amino acid adenylation domain-containing protein
VIKLNEFIGIVTRLKQVAKEFPDHIAVSCGKYKMTYDELDEKSNFVANTLNKNYQVSQNVIVILDKGIDLIITILGIFKSGGIFVPIDPNLSTNRIKAIIDQVDGNLIVSEKKYMDMIDEVTYESTEKKNIFSVDELMTDKQSDFTSIYNKNCYIYFTSGSTGKPKGVLGRERSLEHYITWEIEEFGINENFVVSQLTFPAFDPFLRDVFVPLLSGATLAIPEESDIILQPKKLVQWITENHINLIHLVPSIFKVIMQCIQHDNCFYDLKYILLAGELLRANDIKKFMDVFKDRIQLINLYGPTETTLAKVFYRISNEDFNRAIIPVGKPISLTEVLILDENMKKCVIGKIGDIYIRTPFISSGYYKQPNLTKTVFLANPFGNNPRDIIYKTGDLGKYIDNGNIEVVGRADLQVKINGIRIELGDIENCLLMHEKVKDVAVVDKKTDECNSYLCAYIISEEEIDSHELRTYVSNNLSDYAIPRYFVKIDSMPLLPNGKVDRKALPEPEVKISDITPKESPSNPIEAELIGIWEKVIGTGNIGVNDNFFDIGGTSLLLINMHLLLDEKYPDVVKVTDIFASSTVSKLAAFISTKLISMEKENSIKPIYLDCNIFKDQQLNSETAAMVVEIDSTTRENMNKLAEENEVDENTILISMYMYLFFQLSNNEEIEIQILEKNSQHAIMLNVEFDKMNNFNDLFHLVQGWNEEGSRKLSVNQLDGIYNWKKDNLIVPLYCSKSSSINLNKLLNFYDILLEPHMDKSRIILEFHYDSGRLSKKGIRQIVDGYIELVNSLLEQYA